MSIEGLAAKYIGSAEKVLKELQQTKETVTVSEADTARVLSWATDYLKDAKYYKAQG